MTGLVFNKSIEGVLLLRSHLLYRLEVRKSNKNIFFYFAAKRFLFFSLPRIEISPFSNTDPGSKITSQNHGKCIKKNLPKSQKYQIVWNHVNNRRIDSKTKHFFWSIIFLIEKKSWSNPDPYPCKNETNLKHWFKKI